MERRSFLKSILVEAIHFREEIGGIQQFRLSEIRDLPDEKLSCSIPMLVGGHQFFIDEDGVKICRNGNEDALHIFPLEPSIVIILRTFDGKVSLGEIGCQLAEKMGWEKEQGFARAKEVFFSLIDIAVCVPANFTN